MRCSLDWLILGEEWYRTVAPPASHAFGPLQRAVSELTSNLSEAAENPETIGQAVADAEEILEALDSFIALQVKVVDLRSAVQRLIEVVESSGQDDSSPSVDTAR